MNTTYVLRWDNQDNSLKLVFTNESARMTPADVAKINDIVKEADSERPSFSDGVAPLDAKYDATGYQIRLMHGYEDDYGACREMINRLLRVATGYDCTIKL